MFRENILNNQDLEDENFKKGFSLLLSSYNKP